MQWINWDSVKLELHVFDSNNVRLSVSIKRLYYKINKHSNLATCLQAIEKSLKVQYIEKSLKAEVFAFINDAHRLKMPLRKVKAQISKFQFLVILI